jgi:hypothetical protein
MAKMKWLISMLMALCCLTVNAQTENQQGQTQQQAGQANGNTAPQGNDGKSLDNHTKNAADSAIATQNDPANQAVAGTAAGAPAPAQTSTPAVSQTTTSSSGSPAVLSGQKGSGRDGTNNVQRATMNMAGSPAHNLSLPQKTTDDVASESKDRQQYTQAKQASAERQRSSRAGSGNSGDGNSEQINNNNRKENNDLSDQNKSSKNNSRKTSGNKQGKKNG